MQKILSTWVVRLIFAAVFAVNVYCAVQFIIDPQTYIAAYQLEGAGGEAAIRGYGITFLMWNATYPLFIIFPKQQKILGGIIIVQQLIGCLGEVYILGAVPTAGYETLISSTIRFIAFDAAGLVLMLLSYAWMLKANSPKEKK